MHEKTDGFAANASKTFAAPAMALYEAWADGERRNRWLPDAPLNVRKATPGKSLRITWADGSSVDANLTARGADKSQVAIQHSRLPDAETAAQMKAFWGAALERLRILLEG